MALTRSEYERILAKIDNTEDELMMKFAVSTGMRREDMFAVKIADINLDKKKVTFIEHKKHGRLRTIDLEDAVVLLIKKHLKHVRQGQKRLFSFTGRTGYTHFQKWCIAAGVEPRPFHTLRATCAKFCQAAGRKEQETAELLGDTKEVVHLYYTTPSDDEMAEVAREKPIA
jgi:integrase